MVKLEEEEEKKRRSRGTGGSGRRRVEVRREICIKVDEVGKYDGQRSEEYSDGGKEENWRLDWVGLVKSEEDVDVFERGYWVP